MSAKTYIEPQTTIPVYDECDVLVVGGGGREPAIIRSLKKNPEVETIYALPGNGGIAADATCVPIGATEIHKIVAILGDYGEV